MNLAENPLIRFHNKDITTVPLPNGEKQAFFRQAPHLGQNPKEGKWQPLIGITISKNTTMPAVAETRPYWRLPIEPGVNPGMGNKILQNLAKELNQANLPEPKEITWDPKKVNKIIGTEAALEINETLERIDQERKAKGQKSLSHEIEAKANNVQKKVDELKSSPFEKNLIDNLISLTIRLGEKRAIGYQNALVPAKTILALLVLSPILHLGTLQAKDAKAMGEYPAKERIDMAFNHLQSLNGSQLKALLSTIPEKERVQLVEHLPSKLLPPLIPKGMAARNLNLIPDKELQKRFEKLSEEEFEITANSIPKESQDRLFKLLIESIKKSTSQTKTSANKDADLQIT